MRLSHKEYAELIARKPYLVYQTSSAKSEPTIRHESVAEAQGKISHSDRISVRITSYRKRLLDPDNLCPKYFIDCLRYAGLIPNDRQEDIELRVSQVKVRTGEHTEIVITPL